MATSCSGYDLHDHDLPVGQVDKYLIARPPSQFRLVHGGSTQYAPPRAAIRGAALAARQVRHHTAFEVCRDVSSEDHLHWIVPSSLTVTTWQRTVSPS
jgi:hypothetical protein